MSAFATSHNSNKSSEFETQRSELLREIALGMESVLQYINRLNRNLESIIAVGNEFGSVEALWSQFENVMGTEESGQQQQQQQHHQQQGHGGDEDVKEEEEEEGEEEEGQQSEEE